MASRRAPLANNLNAINSPFRSVATVAGKRTRAQSADPREHLQGQPPLKKQLLDAGNEENTAPRSFTRQTVAQQEAEGKVFLKRTSNAPPTAFERKLAAARKPTTPKSNTVPADRPHRSAVESLDNIRQWQRHYRRAFPQYVFYFESVPEEVRLRMSRQVQYLGAKEEKFFSKSVTHVVTTRAVPAEQTSTSPEDSTSATSKPDNSTRTIDPSLLDRAEGVQTHDAFKRTANLLDATLQSRNHHGVPQSLQNIEPRKLIAPSTDILSKARALGIKIWALEKLQRMMVTMFDADTGEQPAHGHLTRSHAATNLALGKPNKEADLQQLLRNEKHIGPADRDMAVAPHDMVPFRGYYLYVHDMDEKTRPVMMRDYPKVNPKENGKWPQFRLTATGRCPFIEDVNHQRKLALQEQRAAAEAREREMAPRTRSRAAASLEVPSQQALRESNANLRRSPRKVSQTNNDAKPLDPPKRVPTKTQPSMDSMPAMFGSAQANMRGLPRFIGGEPVASGVQPSNITSAIRSQIMSSTAISSTAPGARMGTSKEVHALKRKVLERGTSTNAPSNATLTSSYMNDMRAAINGDGAPPPRAAKRRAQDALGQIYEEPEVEEDKTKARKAAQARVNVVVQKELKPGYCENCRDKFDDFDDHCRSRKHRKFALAAENWSQLDNLLAHLERPLKL